MTAYSGTTVLVGEKAQKTYKTHIR